MKTKLPVLFALLFIASAAMAQFHLGIKAGSNFTKIDGKSFKDEFRYGYSLGGFAEIGSGKVSIQPEVLFNQYRSRTDSSFNNVYQNAFKSTNDIKLNYLSIPILLNYKLVGNLITLQAGPQFGILMNHDNTLVENGKDAFKHGDFSILGGVQVKVLAFRISGRYVVGLNNINDIGDQNKWKNQGLQLAVGFAL